MSIISRNALKAEFISGTAATADKFADVFDSHYNRNDDSILAGPIGLTGTKGLWYGTIGATPTTLSATGSTGQFATDGNFAYFCYAQNQWIALPTTNYPQGGTVSSSFIPDTDIAYDLGATGHRFRDIYISGTTIYMGNSTMSTDNQGNFLFSGASGSTPVVIGPSGYNGVNVVTYTELTSLIDDGNLNAGSYYLISDFKTAYDQPDYSSSYSAVTQGNYRVGATHALMVFALSSEQLSIDAYQPDYPNDKLKYDVSYSTTFVSGGTAFGRIIERIDEWNNRTDYDHREVRFKRYRHYYHDLLPLGGTVSIGGTSIEGFGTQFDVDFTAGDFIVLPETSQYVFQINTIYSPTAMGVTGISIPTSSNQPYHRGIRSTSGNNTSGYNSYYQNNIEGATGYQEYPTFFFDNEDIINNYLGDYYSLRNWEEPTFDLPNNVFGEDVINNRIGAFALNNTFVNDIEQNQIGDYFISNIYDGDSDDFTNNVIGNNFQNNVIAGGQAWFRDNRIGNYFQSNLIDNEFDGNVIGDDFDSNIVNGEFTKNQIENNFNNNEIYHSITNNRISNDFYDNTIYNPLDGNVIGSEFNNNTIGEFTDIGQYNFNLNQISEGAKGNWFKGDVYRNILGSDFASNEVGSDFGANVIGTLFWENSVEDNFQDNNIGNYFIYNTIDVDFRYNTIANGFVDNSIGTGFEYNNIQSGFDVNIIGNEFRTNTIGNGFTDNNIGDNFGFGGNEPIGNQIGNNFNSNNIGEYFYNNRIVDGFEDNEISDDFQNNDIQIAVTNTDFNQYRGNIVGISNDAPNGTDGTYGPVSPNGGTWSGNSASFDIVVSGGIVTDVTVNNQGRLYSVGDILIISGSEFGGTAGVNDLVIGVDSVSGNPLVYEATNSTIVRDANGNDRLYYLSSGGFTVIGINETYD